MLNNYTNVQCTNANQITFNIRALLNLKPKSLNQIQVRTYHYECELDMLDSYLRVLHQNVNTRT